MRRWPCARGVSLPRSLPEVHVSTRRSVTLAPLASGIRAPELLAEDGESLLHHSGGLGVMDLDALLCVAPLGFSEAGVGRVSAPNHSSEQAAMPLSKYQNIKDRWGKRSVPIASRGADRTSGYVRNVGDRSVLAVEKAMLPGTKMRRSSDASIISPMTGADTHPNGMDSTLYLTAS